MKKETYNLSKIQKFFMPLFWFLWITQPVWGDTSKRKTWHELKKGMEPHTHKFTREFIEGGFTWYGCEHTGCSFVQPSREFLKPFKTGEQ